MEPNLPSLLKYCWLPGTLEEEFKLRAARRSPGHAT